MLIKIVTLVTSGLMLSYAGLINAAPTITGEPVIVQHLGKIDWPQDDDQSTPYLTQLSANDVNDLHGDVSCDLIISTPGNYHMALRDAMKGNADLGMPVGLQEQVAALKVTVCWSTSPPVGPEQIEAESLEFKNIKVLGRPALVVGPGKVMDKLVADGQVDVATRQVFLQNKGNVMLVRADKRAEINNVCDLNGKRIVTPNPGLEPGSFGNFSNTIFNVAAANTALGCDAAALFESIFNQNVAAIDTSAFANPYDIAAVQSVFTSGVVKWVASSRIMHRDVPYALCHDQADAGVIFFHQAEYLKDTLGATGCDLEIVNLDGSTGASELVAGNRIGKLHIAKVIGNYNVKVTEARDLIYDFLATSPVWGAILTHYGMVQP